MSVDWQTYEAGPRHASQTVLLLPGGMCAARSYADVMKQPDLDDVRLIAVTMPGHAGAPPPDDYSVENYARLTGELAVRVGAKVLVGFSMGATVAMEMVAAGVFTGPTVLLGISMSPTAEPAFFRGIVRLGGILGNMPAALLRKGAGAMVGKASLSEERKRELREDFAKNNPRDMRLGLDQYLKWLHSPESHAERLCRAGVPTWVVHAEKGDGGLTDSERATLEACPQVEVVTIPGDVFFLPNEVPDQIAAIIVAALKKVGPEPTPAQDR